MPTNNADSSSSSADEQARAREEFKKAVLAYFERSEYRYSGRHVDKAAFFTDFVRDLQQRSNLTRQAAEAVAVQTTADALAEEIQWYRGRIRTELQHYDFQLIVLDGIAAFLDGLDRYEFLKAIGGGVVNRNAKKIKGSAVALKRDLAELQRIDQGLAGALTPTQGSPDGTSGPESLEAGYLSALASVFAPGEDGPIQVVQDRRSAIRAFYKNLDDRIEAIGKASVAMNDASNEIKNAVTGTAVESYIATHPTPDMKELEAFRKAAGGVITAVGTATVPPGFGWITGIADLAQNLIGRYAESKLTAAAKDEYDSENVPGTIFAEYAENPLLMAEALNRKVLKNLKTLLAAVGFAGHEMKGAFPFIKAGIEAVVEAWLEERIQLARTALSTARSAETLKQKTTEFLGEMKRDVGKELADVLQDEKNWSAATKQYLDEHFDRDWATELSTHLIKPLADQIVKLLPVDAAQVVTDQDLSGVAEGAHIVLAIPEKYRETPQVTTDDGPRFSRSLGNLETFVGRFSGKILRSDARRDGKVGDHNQARVMVACRGIKVWGHLVGPDANGEAAWVPETFDSTEHNPAWQNRRITNDGYMEDGQQPVTGGTWYRVKELSHCHIFVHRDGRAEALADITRTKLYRAGETFAKVTLDEIELTPDPR